MGMGIINYKGGIIILQWLFHGMGKLLRVYKGIYNAIKTGSTQSLRDFSICFVDVGLANLNWLSKLNVYC